MPKPDEQAIARLTEEALPHVAVVQRYLTSWLRGCQVTDAEYVEYSNSVDAFRAVRDRLPDCELRTKWTEILGRADDVLQKPELYDG